MLAPCQGDVTLFTKTGDRWGEGWSLLLLGASMRDGRPAEAEPYLKRGLALCQESGDQSVLSYASFNLGAVVRELGHYAQAQQYIEQGVRLSEEIGNILGLGYAFFRRGQLEIAQGKYGQAIQTLEQSATYFKEVGAIHFNSARVFLGIAFHLKGDYSQAKQLYAELLAEFTAVDNKLWLARCLCCLGWLAYDLNELHQAEQYLLEALTGWQAIVGQEAGMATTLAHLGQVLVSMGKHRHIEARAILPAGPRTGDAAANRTHSSRCMCWRGAASGAVGSSGTGCRTLDPSREHKASTFDTQEKARQRLSEITSQFPSLGAQVAQAQSSHKIYGQLLQG